MPTCTPPHLEFGLAARSWAAGTAASASLLKSRLVKFMGRPFGSGRVEISGEFAPLIRTVYTFGALRNSKNCELRHNGKSSRVVHFQSFTDELLPRVNRLELALVAAEAEARGR